MEDRNLGKTGLKVSELCLGAMTFGIESTIGTGKMPAQVTLNWVLNRHGVTAPIIGVRNLKHLEDNLGAADRALSEDHMDRLNQVSEKLRSYPYDMAGRA